MKYVYFFGDGQADGGHHGDGFTQVVADPARQGDADGAGQGQRDGCKDGGFRPHGVEPMSTWAAEAASVAGT